MLWTLLGVICICGALGGFINALMVRDTVLLPRRVDGTAWQFGFLGNVVIGAAAAAVSWGLYGPYSLKAIWPPQTLPSEILNLTLSAATMAFLTGIGGTKWLNAELQNDLWQAATSKAAAAPSDLSKAAMIPTMSALQAYALFDRGQAGGQCDDPSRWIKSWFDTLREIQACFQNVSGGATPSDLKAFSKAPLKQMLPDTQDLDYSKRNLKACVESISRAHVSVSNDALADLGKDCLWFAEQAIGDSPRDLLRALFWCVASGGAQSGPPPDFAAKPLSAALPADRAPLLDGLLTQSVGDSSFYPGSNGAASVLADQTRSVRQAIENILT